MIPKIIHYCWFGEGTMPELSNKCIASWSRFCPGYKIKKWDESNFDVRSNRYVLEAWKSRKFAFVSDYVRLYALLNCGGIYMDTDVEVVRNIDPFLDNIAFSGFESETSVPTGIMGSERGGLWVKENLEYYKNKSFILDNGKMDLKTNVEVITSYMKKKGLKLNNTYQVIDGLITFYPKDFFCPKDYSTGYINITKNTYTIHHFAGSWSEKGLKSELKKCIHKFIFKIFGDHGHRFFVTVFRKLKLFVNSSKMLV